MIWARETYLKSSNLVMPENCCTPFNLGASSIQVIPNNPGSTDFNLGNTMGDINKKWKRAKFFQQYRLFFRYDLKSKIIIYAWVNHEQSRHS